jgi:hypothetical protein
MKKTLTQTSRRLLPAICIAAVLLLRGAPLLRAENPHHDSKQFIQSKALLDKFADLHFRWLVGNITLPTDQNGNAVEGGTVLMPLPNAPGDGTPASINVTLKLGQSFFLPLLGLPGTSYNDGSAPDPFVDFEVLKSNLTLQLKIDGRAVLEEADALEDFYTQFYFDPPIPYVFPPLEAIIYLQAVGVLHKPLPAGTHVITLDEKVDPIPIFGGVEYHNTFIVTVLP